MINGFYDLCIKCTLNLNLELGNPKTVWEQVIFSLGVLTFRRKCIPKKLVVPRCLFRDCSRIFKWHFMHSWQCLIHNDILKSCVRSSMNEISMLLILKPDFFKWWSLQKGLADFYCRKTCMTSKWNIYCLIYRLPIL